MSKTQEKLKQEYAQLCIELRGKVGEPVTFELLELISRIVKIGSELKESEK